MPSTLRAACIQLNSRSDVEENLFHATSLAAAAAASGAELIAFPEVTDFMAQSGAGYRAYAPVERRHHALAELRRLTARLNVWSLVGSLTVCVDANADAKRIANRSYLIRPDGAVAARYDKIHLFDVKLPNGQEFRESDIYVGGRNAVLAETPWGGAGLSICYDLRFPLLYRRMAQAGASIIFAPAAFTTATGALHWSTLVRARAIETGCFVIAPAQCGAHGEDRRCFGHSMIVDPWGKVLAEGGDEMGVFMATLNLGEVDQFRASIPSPLKEEVFGVLSAPGPETT